jgi:hypothetical protein
MLDVKEATVTKTRKSAGAKMLRAACAALLAASLIATGLIAAPLPAFAQSSTPAQGSSTAVKPKPKRAPTPGQIAARERQTKCAAEWKEAKAGGKVEKGMKWPQYWSACNKRLKGAS